MTGEQPKQDERADAEEVEEQAFKIGRHSDEAEGSDEDAGNDDEGDSEVDEQAAKFRI